jgi:hypothetical protein
MKKCVMMLCIACLNTVFAQNTPPTIVTKPQYSISNHTPVVFTNEELLTLKKLAEKEKLAEYTGNEGSAPKNKTISTINLTGEETDTGINIYTFWSQTLRNSFYYQFRITGKYTLNSNPPPFANIPYSAIHNPKGFKAMVKAGYDFHINPHLQIIPFLRVEKGKNMIMVYADDEGYYIHSNNYAILPGFKLVFVASPISPYIEIYGGVAPTSLTGNFIEGPTPNQQVKGSVQIYTVINEFGFAYKIAEHQALIPFIEYVYQSNKPNYMAAKPYREGGFNINQLTSNHIVLGIKYNYFW